MSKDLFDLFRENENKLNQQPSPKAWSRIERRIQASNQPIARRRSIRSMPSTMGIAASLALVISLAIAFSLITNKEQQPQAIAQTQGPLETEELIIPAHKLRSNTIVETTPHQSTKPLKPIIEGHSEQKLVATVHKSIPQSTRSTTPIDSIREERMGR